MLCSLRWFKKQINCEYHVPGPTPLGKMSKNLSAFQSLFEEGMLGELGRLSYLETLHGAFSTFRRRILRGVYIAWRVLRSGTLEGAGGWSFDPSAEAAMTTARPPLSLIVCPCLCLLSTDYCHSPCCHTLRRCSLTVVTLCLRREEWDRDPQAVKTMNLIGV